MIFTPVALGICLEVTAAAVGTFSKQLIAVGSYRKIWLVSAIGIILNTAVGPLVDAAAYAFAPQTVIAPFAGLDVLFNAVTAPCTLKFQHERLGVRHLVAALMVTGGAASSAFFASTVDAHETRTCEQFLQTLLKQRSRIYMSAEIAFVLGVIVSLRVGRFSGETRGLALGGVAGVLMGNVFLLKGFVGFVRLGLQTGDWNCFFQPTPFVVLAAAAMFSVLGTMFMQRGLKKYKGVYMVTVFEGAHITAACLSGDIVMWEMASSSYSVWMAYWASIFLIIGGILLINTTAHRSEMPSFISRSFGISNPDLPADFTDFPPSLTSTSLTRDSIEHVATNRLAADCRAISEDPPGSAGTVESLQQLSR